jgi:membrane-associated phospholipid phosphatase
MYCGFHFLTDSIAGALAGAFWLNVVYRTVLLPSEHWPSGLDTRSLARNERATYRSAHATPGDAKTS